MFTPVFYRPKTCKPIKYGFHLFDREFNNEDLKRHFYATFTHLATGKNFSVLNTHYWWKSGDAHSLARVKNSLDALRIAGELEVSVFSDGRPPCKYFLRRVQNAYRRGNAGRAGGGGYRQYSSHHAYPDFDWDKNEFFGAPKRFFAYDRAIDHILVDKAHAQNVTKST
jgi:hypothetical protein